MAGDSKITSLQSLPDKQGTTHSVHLSLLFLHYSLLLSFSLSFSFFSLSIPFFLILSFSMYISLSISSHFHNYISSTMFSISIHVYHFLSFSFSFSFSLSYTRSVIMGSTLYGKWFLRIPITKRIYRWKIKEKWLPIKGSLSMTELSSFLLMKKQSGSLSNWIFCQDVFFICHLKRK